jgi:hypothetical protein
MPRLAKQALVLIPALVLIGLIGQTDNKMLLVIPLLVILVGAAVFVLGWRRARPGPGVTVLGEQLAGASEAECQRLQDGGFGPSPFLEISDDGWEGAGDLLRPNEVPLDRLLRDLCNQLAHRDTAERAGTRRSISMGEIYMLLDFVKRSAVFALRHKDMARVQDALYAFALIDSERVDPRDVTWALAILSYAATRIGSGARELFLAAADLANPAVAEMVRAFAAEERDRDFLRTGWGYEEVETEDGVGLVACDFASYDPTSDLLALARDVATMLEADQYRARITLATKLPPVWLRSANDDGAVAQALGDARAAVVIHGDLRPAADPSYARQALWVWVVELSDEGTASRLLETSRTISPVDYSVMGIARGTVFCLTVARSIEQGGTSYETRESLKRFSLPLEAILVEHVAGA